MKRVVSAICMLAVNASDGKGRGDRLIARLEMPGRVCYTNCVMPNGITQ